jgi:hypothetical protein
MQKHRKLPIFENSYSKEKCVGPDFQTLGYQKQKQKQKLLCYKLSLKALSLGCVVIQSMI